MSEPLSHSEHQYPKDSAGRIMTKSVPVASEQASIGDLERLLVRDAKRLETINYVYIVDRAQKLKGVLSVKEIFSRAKTEFVAPIMRTKIASVRPRTDQEHVALIALKHSLKAVPVVDKEGIFLGAVPSDAILQVLHQESVEDALKSGGIDTMDDSSLPHGERSVWRDVRERLPWLIIGLAGGIVAAGIIRVYEEALEAQLLLAAFIPVVVYLSDAVGVQTQTVFIRVLILRQKISLWSYLFRELRISIVLSVVLGILIALVSYALFSSLFISVVVGAALLASVLVAGVVGVLLPYLSQLCKYDPVVASGPFATVVRDVLSLLIYFLIAQAVLGLL